MVNVHVFIDVACLANIALTAVVGQSVRPKTAHCQG